MYNNDGHIWSEIYTDPTVFYCQFCENWCYSKKELMEHKKKKHTEKVSIWSKYDEFGDKNCWFLHTDVKIIEFECSYCDKTFAAQSKLVIHRKKHHNQVVQTCRNMSTGTCKYGRAKCWFNQEESENVNEDENIETMKN